MTNTQKYQIAQEMTKLKLKIDELTRSISNLSLPDQCSISDRIHTKTMCLDAYYTMLDILGHVAYWNEVAKSYSIV